MTKDQRKALAAAQRKSAAEGRAVQVDALTTQTATVKANPSGTLSWTTSLLPQRVRKSGAWVPVDATLRHNADGSYSPRAAAEPLAFSSGGSGPLISMASGKARLSFSWPRKLPTPSVSGATITYPDVFKDVDLRLTANILGGFSEIIVVKTADAAADPALATLKLAVHGAGVKVSDDGHGNLQAATDRGQVMYSAPQPVMWDSGKPASASDRVSAQAATPAQQGAGPTQGASMAPVTDDVQGSTLTLKPDHKLLTSTKTHYPVYTAAPMWNPHDATGTRQHFVETQQGCPTAKNYDSTTYDPDGVGVGYNAWSGCIGLERSYYQLSIPSTVWDAHIVSAKVNATETYAATLDCNASSDVYLYLTDSINANTTWNTKPALGSHLATHPFGATCTSEPSGAFDVTSTIIPKAASKSSSWTFALVNSHDGSGDGAYFKRFGFNPTMTIEYNHVPSNPSSLAAKFGTHSVGCGITSPYPVIGKTLVTTPPTLNAVVSDGDKDALDATYKYWVNSGTATTATSANVASGQNAPTSLSSSFMSGLKTGDTVGWNVHSSDGEDNSATSSTCHFTVDLTAPDQPAVATADNLYPEDEAGTTAAGTPGKFTLSTNSATKFLYGLDASPPTSNTPSSQTATATSNAATITVTPVAPGTHTLYVYAVDSAGNVSTQQEYQFTALGHTTTSYSSLQAAFNNTAVTDDSNKAAGDNDGIGQTFSLQDLKAAGWQPGGKITVDGATFTLPNFSSASGDNVMAANQTIQMDNTGGQALVFLASSTYAFVSSQRSNGDFTSPAVPDGTSVAGSGCTLGNNDYEDCAAGGPSGTITYNDGSTSQAYHLNVPDWVYGDSTLAAVTLPHRNHADGSQEAKNSSIYAFAVPLKPGAKISSVSLPDVSEAAREYVPGLHIFGMAVRDTTSAPNGTAWTGAWSSPTEGANNYLGGSNYTDMTFRVAARPSVSGSSMRIRLSNALGYAPLTIDHTTTATQYGGAAPTATPTDVTFNGGSKTVTIPVGGEVYSDPISQAASPAQPPMISMHLASSAAYLVQHSWANAAAMWVSAPGAGDHTTDTGTTAFTGSGTHWGVFTNILTGIDIVTSGNQPTASVLGDGLVDGLTNGAQAGPVTARLSDDLATALQTNTQGVPGYGLVPSGIINNELTTSQAFGGPALLTRLDRDVLDLPGIKSVVVYTGLKDILAGADDTVVADLYSTLRDQLKAWGIRVTFTTLTPCEGYVSCTAAIDASRVDLNTWITDQVDFTTPTVGYADTESAVAVPDPASTADPPQLQLSQAAAPADFDAGDHVNLTTNGYAAVTGAIDLTALGPDA